MTTYYVYDDNGQELFSSLLCSQALETQIMLIESEDYDHVTVAYFDEQGEYKVVHQAFADESWEYYSD